MSDGIVGPNISIYYDEELGAYDNNPWCLDLAGSTYRFATMNQLSLWFSDQTPFLGSYLAMRPITA